VVVIDPGHGGKETGSRISPNLLEKDVTLSLARRLRQELQSRHIAVSMLRDTDIDLSLDQRAVAANLLRPAVFISLHAEPGTILRIYTPALPVASDSTTDRSSFLPWQSAQAAFSADSNALAIAAAQAIGKRQLAAQVRPAFLQPLHSIAAAAIALEAPAESKGLRIPEDQIAGALADAIAARKQAGGTQ
jgi:N-acetylmuramoyl-L-alanine amidase